MSGGDERPTVRSDAATLLGKFRVGEREGRLALRDGRLSFTTREGKVVLDVPVGELHSAAPWSGGLVVWGGSRRYLFRFARPAGRALYMPDDSVGQLLDGVTHAFSSRGAGRTGDVWAAQLRPLIGDPPPGVVARAPWSDWRIIGSILGGAAALTGLASLAVFVTR